MLLSMNIYPFLAKGFTCEEAVEIAAAAGFDALDFSFKYEKFYGQDTDGDAFKQIFLRLRDLAEEKNLCFNQAHAPMHSSYLDQKETDKMFGHIVRSMRNASYLGIDSIVVHPKQHLNYAEDGVPEKLFEMNMDFYNRLKPYCEEFNIKVAIENMWQQPAGKKINHSVCSRPEEFIRYIDELNSEWFVACLDIGHACLVCENPANFIRQLETKRLKNLHVHDVDGIEDLHTAPYMGIVDWDSVVSALKEIGYDGDFTYEVGNVLINLPKEVFPSGVRHIAEIGRYLMRKTAEREVI